MVVLYYFFISRPLHESLSNVYEKLIEYYKDVKDLDKSLLWGDAEKG